MGSCAAPSAKGDDKFITTDYLQQCLLNDIARGQSDPRKIVLQWDEMIRTAGSLKLGKVQVSVLVRSLLKSERPSGLTQAIIEVGR
ncbi:Tn3 family transposase, partial [Escherichia coli]